MAQLKVTSQAATPKAKSMNGTGLRRKAEWISIMKGTKVMSQISSPAEDSPPAMPVPER